MFVPPWTSCISWAIADLNSEEILFSKNIDYECQPASLTKIMTFYCILQFYSCNENQMKEDMVIVSKRAADCKNGTHANLQQNDILSVYDLLYAMMLPSGNDAAIALAEYVGCKMLNKSGMNDDYTDEDAYKEFISTMNKTCKRLYLKSTYFGNVHGMRNNNNKTTVSDLLFLTFHCRSFKLFNQVTSTKKYQCKIKGKFRYKNVTYHNTHCFIGVNGYLWYINILF